MKVKLRLFTLIVAVGLLWATGAFAQIVGPQGFDMTGYIQAATRDGSVAGQAAAPVANTAANAGGTLTINSIKILVPNNSIVQMPAASFTWAQLFDPAVSAPNPAGRPNHVNGQTGMAITDVPQTILPGCEVRVVGNISPDPVTGAPRYIAGLILPISGELLNNVSGNITYIYYPNNWFRVGGIPGDVNSGVLVQINDPVGRYGKIHTRDPRFTADTSNPTVTTASGYPVGLPTVAPTLLPNGTVDPTFVGDPLRPYTNRPKNGITPGFPADPFLAVGAPLKTFTMPAPGGPAGSPDPTKQVPLMLGDWVDVQGTMFKQDPAGPITPSNWFIHAHSLTAHLGIQTQPGIPPAYVRVESVPMGVGPNNPPAAPVEETSSRLVVVAFSTDNTAIGSLFAIDVNPTTGAETEVLVPNAGTIPIDDPIRGRMRLQLNKNLPEPPGNAILSPSTGGLTYTREYILKLSTGQTANVANGLTAGQYRFPQFDYIFPEGAVFGQPIPPYNFQDFNFLAVGNGPGSGRLDPWPGP